MVINDWNILRVHDGTRYDGDGASMIVQSRLIRIGIASLMPVVAVERRIGKGRSRHILTVPRFPGYLFTRAVDAARIDAEHVPGATGWMMGPGDGRLTVGSDIIGHLMQDKGRTLPGAVVHEIVVGDRIVPVRGPMKGWEMPVVGDDGECLRVTTPIMGGIEARISARDVEKVASLAA